MEQRIEPLPFAEWDDEARELLPRHLLRPQLYEPQGDLPMSGALCFFARHIRLGEAWLEFSGRLLKEPLLDPRHREILVLRVAWRSRSQYEWMQHVRMAQQAGGLTHEHVEAAMEGPDAAVWTPLEGALVRATDELIDRSVVSDATWKQLAEHFDEQELIEVLWVVASYLALALVFNSAGLPPDGAHEYEVPPLPLLER